MVASAVFITDLGGKAIISRNYRGDVPLTRAIERFSKYLTDVPEEQKKPIFHIDSSGEANVEEDVGGVGPGGETFVYISVSINNFLYQSTNDSTWQNDLSGGLFPFPSRHQIFTFAP